MASPSDPILLTKKASKLGKAGSTVAGVVMISENRVRWSPDDPTSAQPVSLDISSITKRQQVPGKPFLRLLSSSSNPFGFGFESDEDKNDVFDLLSQLLPPPLPTASDQHGGNGARLPSSSSPGLLLPTPTQKSTLFKTDPDLEILYNQLVKSGVLTEPEFWKPRQQQLLLLFQQLQQQQQSSTTANANANGTTTSRKQRQGISSALPNVRPSIDGQTDKVTFTITPEIIQMIFAEQPEVHRAYLANVPHAMSDVAFWETYCKWELKKQARRRRASKEGKTLITAAEAAAMEKAIEEDVLFAPHRRAIASVEAQRAKRQAKMVDPGVDLAADAAEYYGGGGLSGIGGGGRGNGSEDILIDRSSNSNRGGGGGGGGGPSSSTMAGNNNMDEYYDEGPSTIAAQINRHAALVLQGSDGGGMLASAEDIKGKDAAAIAAQLARAQAGMALGNNRNSSNSKRIDSGGGGGGGGGNVSVGDVDVVDAGLRKLWKDRAASGLEDLNDDNDDLGGGRGGGGRKKGQEAAALRHPQTYFQIDDDDDEEEEDVELQKKKKKMKNSNYSTTTTTIQNVLNRIHPTSLHLAPPPPSTAAAVLLELSGGGHVDQALVKEFGPAAADALMHDPREVLPGVMVDFFRGEALKVNELLRHLWACIPINIGINIVGVLTNLPGSGSSVRKERGKRLVQAAQRMEVELQAHIKANAGANEQVVIAQMVRPLLQALRAGVEAWQREEVAAAAASVSRVVR